MDEIVKKAMAKWPDVPHCFGWLALDARGQWRMRDEHAQAAGLPGDRLHHTALIGFINRNYEVDAQGRWHFQNGPQRVYVDLAATPYIARTDPGARLLLHTGAPLGTVEAACMTPEGALVLQAGAAVAQVDDRDVGTLLAQLHRAGAPVGDDALLAWLDGGPGALTLQLDGAQVPVTRVAQAALAPHFGFVAQPRA